MHNVNPSKSYSYFKLIIEFSDFHVSATLANELSNLYDIKLEFIENIVATTQNSKENCLVMLEVSN